MKFLVSIFSLMLAFNCYLSYAQNEPQKTIYNLQPTDTAIILDGKLEESSWRKAEIASDFYMNIPYDDRETSQPTEVKMTYDEDYFYVAFICYGSTDKFIVQSLRRDWDWLLNENISIYIDPYNDYTNGFSFGLTPYNVQREGTIDEGTNVNTDWDNKWFSATKVYKDKWVAEMAIPFKSIRYGALNQQWNIQFFRNHLNKNERSSWIAVEQQYTPSALTFSGKVLWPEPPPEAGSNISLIPYVLGNLDRNFQNPALNTGYNANAGFDAKIGITNALNLDLTANPDFSQVEVDRQVINLSRFEVRFPERRQFFLENADLFSKFGFPDTRAFFSRRIGIATDTLGRSQQVPILGGARLSGKVNERLRIGALNMITDRQEQLKLPYQNYAVLALQQNLFKRSNLSIIFANKDNLGVQPGKDLSEYNPQIARRNIVDGDTTIQYKLFNRVIGGDFNLFTEDTKWVGEIYYQHSFDSWNDKQVFNHGAFIRYQTRNYSLRWFHSAVGNGFNAEMGFVPRVGYVQGSFSPTYINYPENDKVISQEFSFDISYTANTSFTRLTDRGLSLNYSVDFTNTASLAASADRTYQYMFFDFNPIAPRGDSVLVEGSEYEWNSYNINFQSDRRPVFTYENSLTYGGFYNGTRLNLNGLLSYRFQPYGSFAVSYDYNRIKLAEYIGQANFYLIGPRLDLTVTDAIFFTGFAQYNNRFDNVNYNLRLQWRFAPASDLFLVYTENSFPSGPVDFIPGGDVKNRAVVLKINYWFNL